MKKVILITLGVLTILIIVGLWVYLFFFNTSEGGGGNPFANLGFGKDAGQPAVTTSLDAGNGNGSSENTSERARLRQLTTRSVAGAIFITEEQQIRFIEQGTGHIYSIPVGDGSESIISGTTILGTTGADFSASGNRVLFTSEKTDGEIISIGTITRNDSGEGVIQGVNLPVGAREASFTSAGNVVRYLLPNKTGSVGYMYNILENTHQQLFVIPLKDIEVLWGDVTYVYTTPTGAYRGYIYKLVGDTLTYVANGAFGLTGFRYEDGVILTAQNTNGVISKLVVESGVSTLPISALPEKCASSLEATSTLYCATPFILSMNVYPDDWYKGIVSLNDSLWEVNTLGGAATELINFEHASGRQIDVSYIRASEDGQYLYFINKNDDSLWLYKL